jgi:6-phosphogluconolactonase
MISPVEADVRIFPDAEALSRAAAESLAGKIRDVARSGTFFHLALAGGNTPRTLYRRLDSDYRDDIPWTQVHIFWGDERYVPPEDPHSNYRMARESLLDHVPIPAKNVHPMPTNFSEPDDAARAYERTLASFFSPPWPRLNLVLLGLGADGHTASLFPKSAALAEKERWVVAVEGPTEPRLRLTLTLHVLTHSAEIYFLVTGADKAEALRRTLAGAPDPSSCPAAAVASGHPAVVWWTDTAAAKLVSERSQTGP